MRVRLNPFICSKLSNRITFVSHTIELIFCVATSFLTVIVVFVASLLIVCGA